ncbi:MAG: IS110 family transposase, partial [Candidatus Scalindua rubra]|nr:IS110 family transposase [Candidatus Scalindua rubra]
MVYVGIDWADDHHDVHITNDTTKLLAKFQISHDCDGFADLHNKIKSLAKDPVSVSIAIETNKGLLVNDLLTAGYTVYAINPKTVNRYKDRHVLSKAKSDSIDAEALANILRTDSHRFRPLKPMPEDYCLLDRLCIDLRKIVDEKSKVLNQITSCLKEFYPKALDIFSLDTNISIAFLKKYPDPQSLSRCKKKSFSAFLKKQKYSHPKKESELWRKIKTPALESDIITTKAGHLRLLALLDQLIPLREHLTCYEKEVRSILNNLPTAEPISTLPGVGERLAPELIAALGPNNDIKHLRFQSPDEIMKLSGCVPITRQSGKWKKVSVRYACVKTLRRTFYDWAFASLKHSDWARAYYDYHKNNNQRHSTILRNLGKKWSKILFAVWSKKLTYNEELH